MMHVPINIKIYMFASLLVPSNPGRLGMPIYIITVEILGGEGEREYYTFVVVPVVSMETRIMCVY